MFRYPFGIGSKARIRSPYLIEVLEERRLLATALFQYHLLESASPLALVTDNTNVVVADGSTLYFNGSFADDATGDEPGYHIPTGTITLHWYQGNEFATIPLSSYPAPSNPNILIPYIPITPVTVNLADAGTPLTSGPDAGGYIYYVTYSGDDFFHPNNNTGINLYNRALAETDKFGNINQIIHFEEAGGSLGFQQGPTNSAVDGIIDPPVTVTIKKSDGSIDTSKNIPVTLTLNPLNGETGVLAGNVTVNAVNGVATFDDLQIDKPGNYTITASASGETSATSSSFKVSDDKLVFSTQPTNALAGTEIDPPVVVKVVDGSNNPDTTVTGSITLTLNPFSGSGSGALGGSFTSPIVDGVATFDNVSISKNGIYQLQATDTNDNPASLSDKFVIGPNDLALAIRTRVPKRAGGVVEGDHLFYSVQISPKKAVDTQSIVITLPEGLVPDDLTGGATFDGNTITCDVSTTRVITFTLTVPDPDTLAQAVTDGDKLVVTAKTDVTYTDSTKAISNATNTVKVGVSREVTGSLHDALFDYPKRLFVNTGKALTGVTVDLLDETGAVVATGKTAAGGSFSVVAPKAGTYQIRFQTLVDFYTTAGDGLSTRTVYIGQFVTIKDGNTKPVDLGTLVLSKSFFNSAAKILKNVNGYNTSGFQGLSEFSINLFRFNTTNPENVLTALAGTEANPSAPLDPDSLSYSDNVNEWVGAMRMIAGIATVDSRFLDTFRVTDQLGKIASVFAAAQFSAKLGKSLFQVQKKFPSQPKWSTLSISAADQKLYNAYRVGIFSTLGAVLSPALDQAGVAGNNKAKILAVTFNVLRYSSDLLTGKLIDDLGFELVFNVIRVAFDMAVLSTFTRVQVRSDVPFPFNLAVGIANSSAQVFASEGDFQGQIDALANNRLAYDPNTDTSRVLTTLSEYDDDLHQKYLTGARNLSILNGITGLLRGVTGVVKIQAGVEATNPGIQFSTNQAIYQKYMKALDGAVDKLPGGSSKVQLRALQITFASGAFSVFQQVVGGFYIEPIARTGNVELSSAAALSAPMSQTSKLVASAEPTPSAEPISPSQQVPVLAANAADSDTYVSDLNQLAAMVKKKDLDGINALYPQFAADDASFFNDLVALSDQADAVIATASEGDSKVLQTFTAAVEAAVSRTLYAQLQLDLWGADISTGNARLVTGQLLSAIKAVKLAARYASNARDILSGKAVPATFSADFTAVPTEFPSGTTQSIAVTVTNIGSVQSEAGTITFKNTDGTIVAQEPVTQSLRTLAAGESATFTWTVQVTAPPEGQTLGTFSVDILAGEQESLFSNQITLA